MTKQFVIGLAAMTCIAFARPAAASGRLHTDGMRIVDSAGRQVVLRGVCAGGRSKLPPFYPFEPVPDSSAALNLYADQIASLGANVVRLLVIYEAAEPVRGTYDEKYLAVYDAMVEAFARRGIRVIVDSHQDVFSRRFCGDGFPDWMVAPRYQDRRPRHDCLLWEAHYYSDPVARSFDRLWSNEDGVQDRYVEFFSMLAERYRDEPAVIGFEPINEPFPGWWGLAHYSEWYTTQLHPFYERVAAAVQAVDPSYLVFADICSMENFRSFSESRPRPNIENLVFAPHYYDMGYFGMKSGPGGGRDTMLAGLERHRQLAVAWNAPMFVTEYGVSMLREDAADYLTDLYSVFDELQLSGTIWEASMSETLWNRRRKLFMNPDGSFVPTSYAIDRPYPRAVAGTIESFSFDATTRRVELVWTEDPAVSAPTAVYFPRRLYPEPPVVQFDPEGEYTFDPSAETLTVPATGAGGKRSLIAISREGV